MAASDDELDALLQHYDAQAHRDIQAVQERTARPKKRARATAAERREEAMAQPLPASNVGFQLLAAMGYQPGQGIGATAQGRSVPVAVAHKQDRLGLGAVNKSAAAREEQQRRDAAAEERAERHREQTQQQLEGQQQLYQRQAQDRFAARKLAGQLKAAQEALETLDRRAGIDASVMWRSEKDTKEEDLPEQREAHGEALSAAVEGQEWWASMDAQSRLDETVQCLRARYYYCIHCAAQYDGEEDLAAHCPGPGEEAH